MNLPSIAGVWNYSLLYCVLLLSSLSHFRPIISTSSGAQIFLTRWISFIFPFTPWYKKHWPIVLYSNLIYIFRLLWLLDTELQWAEIIFTHYKWHNSIFDILNFISALFIKLEKININDLWLSLVCFIICLILCIQALCARRNKDRNVWKFPVTWHSHHLLIHCHKSNYAGQERCTMHYWKTISIACILSAILLNNLPCFLSLWSGHAADAIAQLCCQRSPGSQWQPQT